MGCDIHDYAEVRGPDGVWAKVGKVFGHPYHRPDEPSRVDGSGYEWNAAKTDHPYLCRNYDVFAILANVRNGRGFAGCDTGDGFVPIAMPRGLPPDVSGEVGLLSEEWGCDGHSHSYLTLAEILAFDFEGQKTKLRGWVDPWNFELFRRKGRPAAYSGGVFGGDTEHVSNQMMARMIDSGDILWEGPEPAADSWGGRGYTTDFQRGMKRLGNFPKGSVGAGMADVAGRYYTLVEWESSYADCAEDFVERTIPALQNLGGPGDVRMVFWFDN